MLNRNDELPQSQPKVTGPLWTQDESISFECAKEVINDLMGICSGEISEEESKENPDMLKIKKLKAERSNLFGERSHLYLQDNATIERIETEYGKRVRDYRENKRKERLNGSP